MLTDDERDHIRAEEIFRTEVRSQLEAASPRPPLPKRLWALVNSAIFLWFLSSIVLAGLTAAVATHQKNRDDQIRKEELRQRITTEVSGRISQAIESMGLDQTNIKAGHSFRERDIYNKAAYYLDNFFLTERSNPRDFSTYPEFRMRNFYSLVMELRGIQDSRNLAGSQEALATYGKLASSASIEGQSDATNAVRRTLELLEQLKTNAFLQPRS